MKGQMSIRRVTRAIFGGIVGVSLLVAFILAFGGGDGGAGGAAASPVGWAFPLGSLAIILGTTWFLLSRTPKDPGSSESVYTPCDSCGRSILRVWRLCPYCGAMLDQAQNGRVPEDR